LISLDSDSFAVVQVAKLGILYRPWVYHGRVDRVYFVQVSANGKGSACSMNASLYVYPVIAQVKESTVPTNTGYLLVFGSQPLLENGSVNGVPIISIKLFRAV
jgi:hypothetical protein